MIRYLKHEEIDFAKWDQCVRSSPANIIYAHSWYLNLVSPFWDALVSDDYEAVFPLTWNRKFGVDYLYQPYFTQQLGMFSNDPADTKLLGEFLIAIPKEFKLIEINLNAKNAIPKNVSFESSGRLTHILNLAQSHDQISSSYSDNLKRNLKKAMKEELTVNESENFSFAIELFKSVKSSVVPMDDYHYELLEKICDYAISNRYGKYFEVHSKDNKIISAGFFLISENQIIHLLSTSNPEGKNTGAASHLMDFVIREYADSNFSFDFEGSNIESVARFYKSFGSHEVSYIHLRQNNLPWWLRFPFHFYKKLA